MRSRLILQLVTHWRLFEGVRRDMEAVRRGMESVIELKHLLLFTAEEVIAQVSVTHADRLQMDELFCGCSETHGVKTWERVQLQQAIKPDHGYNHDSPQIRWLIDMLTAFDIEKASERRSQRVLRELIIVSATQVPPIRHRLAEIASGRVSLVESGIDGGEEIRRLWQ